MINLNQTTLQDLKNAVALIESARKAGISVESAPCAKPKGAAKYVDIGGEVIHKGVLCGLAWINRDLLRVYFVGHDGITSILEEHSPDIQSVLFAIAGYRPYNPWKDGE